MLVKIQYFSINFELKSLLVYLALPEIYLVELAFCAIENNRLILGLGLPRAFFGLGVLVKWFLSCCSSILNRVCSFIASFPWRILSRRWSLDSCSAEWRISVGRLSSWLKRFWKVKIIIYSQNNQKFKLTTKARLLIIQKFSISELFLMDSSILKLSANNVLHRWRLIASIFLMNTLKIFEIVIGSGIVVNWLCHW